MNPQQITESKRYASIALVARLGERIFFGPATRFANNNQIEISLGPVEPKEVGFLRGLESGQTVGYAFGYSAGVGDVRSVRQLFERGVEQWSITIDPRALDQEAMASEMGFDNLSADDLARMRARRILLDERLPDRYANDDLNQSAFEMFVRGWNAPLQPSSSPFPSLYQQFQREPELFLATARLTAVLLLVGSRTVRVVEHLRLQLSGTVLSVEFLGIRARMYANEEPARIEVAGTLALEPRT